MIHRAKRLGGGWAYGEYQYDKGYHTIDGIVVDVNTLGYYSGRKANGQDVYSGDVLGWDGREERGVVRYDILNRKFIVEVDGYYYPLEAVLKRGVKIVGNAWEAEKCQTE